MNPTRKQTAHVSGRLDKELLARLDALIPNFSTPFRRATRSDVLRALLLAGLPAIEREAKSATNRPGGAP